MENKCANIQNEGKWNGLGKREIKKSIKHRKKCH